MRLSGGRFKGQRLKSPPARTRQRIRPTSEKIRQALFSLLGERVIDGHVLDLFAGTGLLGLEALSRGAASAFFVDYSRPALDIVRANIAACKSQTVCGCCRMNLAHPASLTRLRSLLPETHRFDLVFLDPPYQKKLAQPTLAMVEKTDLLIDGGLVVVEETITANLEIKFSNLLLQDQRRYADTGIWIFQYSENSA